jgi:hypothetical protein
VRYELRVDIIRFISLVLKEGSYPGPIESAQAEIAPVFRLPTGVIYAACCFFRRMAAYSSGNCIGDLCLDRTPPAGGQARNA